MPSRPKIALFSGLGMRLGWKTIQIHKSPYLEGYSTKEKNCCIFSLHKGEENRLQHNITHSWYPTLPLWPVQTFAGRIVGSWRHSRWRWCFSRALCPWRCCQEVWLLLQDVGETKVVVYACVCECTCVYMRAYVCIYIYACVCVYVCIYIRVCVHAYVCI